MHLSGTYDLTLGEDRRVALPADWRALLLDGIPRLALGSRAGLPMIELLTDAGLKPKLRVVAADAGDVPDTVKLQAVKDFLAGCRVARLDHHGRLSLPRDWCDAAGLEAGDAMTLVGCGDFAECWNHLNHEAAEILGWDELRKIGDSFGIF
jgi:DNA-binding transcriptional regulator/RsmH inhibitor MraZ